MVTALEPTTHSRLIVKVGSSLLVAADGSLRRAWLETLVDDIVRRTRAGQSIIVVSSGAIALGARQLGLKGGGRASLDDAQAAAATGQILLSQIWSELLSAHSVQAAQILVTLDDLEDRRRYLNAAATLDRLLGLAVVPIINENDSVATAEIRFGDNDRLAARIAQAARANGVILLSDVDGLYSGDPVKDLAAQRIPLVKKVTPKIVALASSATSSGMGSGGMASKIEAARIANAAGVDLVIASGLYNYPLKRLENEGAGTLFSANRHSKARKTWLAGRLAIKGKILIDSGAEKALKSGASLLPAGTTDVEGRFTRGDVVDIVSDQGEIVARGLAEYDSTEAKSLCGLSTKAIAEKLGHAPRSALVHRDHMVML